VSGEDIELTPSMIREAVILDRELVSDMLLSPLQVHVVKLVEQSDIGMTSRQLSNYLKTPIGSTTVYLLRLRDKGYLRRVKESMKTGGYRYVYFRSRSDDA